MKVLLLAGSLRKESLNKKFLNVARRIIQKSTDAEVTVVDLQELQLPVYDGDIEARGFPEGVKTLAQYVNVTDALVISSPEYNASISSPLKNTIDWLSRVNPMPLVKKQILLLGASPGSFGAIRGLGHARAPFETLGNFVYPESFALARADVAFDEDGNLKDHKQYEKVQKLITDFVVYCQKK